MLTETWMQETLGIAKSLGGVNVHWSEKQKNITWEPGSVTLPQVPSGYLLKDNELRLLRGAADTAFSQARFSSVGPVESELSDKVNMLESHFSEDKYKEKFPGAARNLEAYHASNYHQQSEDMRNVMSKLRGETSTIDPRLDKLCDNLLDNPVRENFISLAKAIQDDEQKEQEQEEQEQEEGEGEGEQEGEDQGEDQGEGQGEGEGEDQDSIENLMDKITNENNKTKKKGKGGGPLAELGKKGCNNVVIPPDVRESVDKTDSKVRESVVKQKRNELSKVIGPVKTHLRRILQSKDLIRWRGGQEDGLIDSRYYAEALTGGTNFYKNLEETVSEDTALLVMVDSSGSMMSDWKFRVASDMIFAMNESLVGLNVASKFVSFMSNGGSGTPGSDKQSVYFLEGNYYSVFKDWNETNKQAAKNCVDCIDPGSGNSDPLALRYALEDISKRPEKKKIVIMVSDGMPAFYTRGSFDRFATTALYMRKMSEQFEKRHNVKTIGIGLGEHTDHIGELYENSFMVEDVNQFAKTTIKSIAKEIMD